MQIVGLPYWIIQQCLLQHALLWTGQMNYCYTALKLTLIVVVVVVIAATMIENKVC